MLAVGSRVRTIIGQDAVAKVVKNKYDPPFRSAKFSLHYVHGICNERPLIEDAVADGRLKKSGSWFKFYFCFS